MAAFALIPGQQQVNVVIDYGTTTGTNLYEKVIAVLKNAFDHKDSHNVTLLLEVKERAEKMGENMGLYNILTLMYSNGFKRNLLLSKVNSL